MILTHGRSENVATYKTLKKYGYTGRIVLVVDNEDSQVGNYKAIYGDQVYVFDKAKVAESCDIGDNFDGRNIVLFARNACWDIAKALGLKTFIQLDDDYVFFYHFRDQNNEFKQKPIKDLDSVFDAMLDYYESTPFLSIAMAQTGDFIGGKYGSSWTKPKRKAMNSFVCSVDRPFKFMGRINEDTSAYTWLGSMGGLFLTIPALCLCQKGTQQESGGLTEAYLDLGTYVKSFYSILYQPSSVKISTMGATFQRIHHQVKWRYTVPCILREEYRNASS